MHFRSIILVSALAVLAPVTASAQDSDVTEYVPEDEIKQVQDEKRSGFDGTLAVNANANLVSNRNVVGQTDGFSTLLGLGLASGLDYVNGRHELRNTLLIAEAFAKTPVLREFIKSDDSISLESLYNYFLLDWAGLFGRLNLESALFKAESITAEPTDYVIARPDGTVDTVTTERLRLSDSFQPLTFNQSLGVFAEPVQTDPFRLSTRVGFGLRETWAQNVLVVQDDGATENVVEVTDITNPESSLTVFQGGAEAFVGVAGTLQNNRVTYDAGGSVLVPFINNDPQDRTATQLTRVGVAAGLNVAVFEWMSFAYRLRLTRDPQLVEGLQHQNSVLLTFNYTFIERTEPDAAPEPTEAELEAEAAKKRAAEAEQRAVEAEQRAAELQRQLEAQEETPPAPDAPPTTPDEPAPQP